VAAVAPVGLSFAVLPKKIMVLKTQLSPIFKRVASLFAIYTRACAKKVDATFCARVVVGTLMLAFFFGYFGLDCAAADAVHQGSPAVEGEAPAVVPKVSADEAGYGETIKALYGRDMEARRKAREALIKAGPGAIKSLIPAVHNAQFRETVIRIITAMGPEAVTELVKLLQDAELADKAGSALFSVIGPDSVNAAPALVECMQNTPRANGYCGAALVRIMGPKGKKYVPQLLQALKAPDKTARVYAAAALGEIGPGAKEAVQGLTAALSDFEERVRLAAAVALGKIGKKAKAAAQKLEKMAADDVSGEVRREAAEALKKIRGG